MSRDFRLWLCCSLALSSSSFFCRSRSTAVNCFLSIMSLCFYSDSRESYAMSSEMSLFRRSTCFLRESTSLSSPVLTGPIVLTPLSSFLTLISSAYFERIALVMLSYSRFFSCWFCLSRSASSLSFSLR